MRVVSPRFFLFVVVLAYSMAPILAHADYSGDGASGDLSSNIGAYEQEVAAMMNAADEIVAEHRAGEPAGQSVDALVAQWEKVEFHEALENNAMALYPPIWVALGGLKEAVAEDAPKPAAQQWRNRLAAALHEGVGALKVMAANRTRPDASAEALPAVTDNRSETVVIKDHLQNALVKYRQDNVDAAIEQVHKTYMQRFEGIEGDLIEQDADLVTELEADFNATLPTLMKQGAPADKVSSQIDSMSADLDKAQSLLDDASKQQSEVF